MAPNLAALGSGVSAGDTPPQGQVPISDTTSASASGSAISSAPTATGLVSGASDSGVSSPLVASDQS